MRENQQVLHTILIPPAVMNLHHLPLLRFIVSVILVFRRWYDDYGSRYLSSPFAIISTRRSTDKRFLHQLFLLFCQVCRDLHDNPDEEISTVI